MADPLTIIGTAASVANIVEILVKIVGTLNELHSQWKKADLTFISLIAQLIALKAALNKIQEWMDGNDGESHHQLVMDLEVSISCCWMLVSKMDSEISDLSRNDGYGLEPRNKMKLIVKNGTLEELQKRVEQQTNALTLLLTACNCKAISDQKLLLEKSSTRKIFQRVKDDSPSLYVHRGSTSLYSRCTDNLSKISKMFEFDRELYVTKVYEKALQGALSETREMQRARLIDKQLKEDLRREQRVKFVRVLLIGDEDCKRVFTRQLMLRDKNGMKGFTAEELREYRTAARDKVRDIMKKINSLIEEADIEMDERTKSQAEILAHEVKNNPLGHANISADAAEAVQKLLTSDYLSKASNDARFCLHDSAHYFISGMNRIIREDYVPSEAEFLRIELRSTTIREYHFDIAPSFGRPWPVCAYDVSGQRANIKKWINQVSHVRHIWYFVDLCQYCQMVPGDGEKADYNNLEETLQHFETITTSPWVANPSILLIFDNVYTFRKMLNRIPLSKYFPDYSGGSDVNKAANYILNRFRLVNRAQLDLDIHICLSSGASNAQVVVDKIRECIIYDKIKETWL